MTIGMSNRFQFSIPLPTNGNRQFFFFFLFVMLIGVPYAKQSAVRATRDVGHADGLQLDRNFEKKAIIQVIIIEY